MKLLEGIWDEIILFYYQFVEIVPLIIIGLVVSILFLWISKAVRLKLIGFINKKAEDPLQINFLSNIFKIINGIISVLIFLYIIGKQDIIASILGAGAVSAFVLGFAFKDIGENFLAGVILAFKRPFRIGDTVKVNGIIGSIIGLSLRETHIKTFDGQDVYIPNGMIIKNPLHNYTIDGYLRQDYTVGVDYNTDIDQARKIILDVVNGIPGVLQEVKIAKTLISDLKDTRIDITTQYWINTFDSTYSGTEIKSQAINTTLQALKSANIVVPGNVMEIKNI